MFRLWLTSTAIGTCAAWYSGLDPFAPYLYEVIILGALVFGAGFLMLVAGALSSSILLVLVVGALPLAMGYGERILQREIKPSGAFHRYGADAPVGLQTRIEGSHLYGRITNRHPRDWLRLAMVQCTLVFANGTPSQRVREISVGAGGWLASGEEVEQPLLSSSGLLWEPGLSMTLTTCGIGSADFYADPEVKPAFTFAKDKNNHYVFEVTNTRLDAILTQVGFSCWVLNAASGSNPHKQDLRVIPLYADGNSYRVPPEQRITLYNTQLFAGRSITSCAVKEVSWGH
ncbi:hypothetical protein ASF58_23925 [Methylobacterium sp. Leaf125]|uniref:hypothetical protein n=1 Tax=Methylobacterium sp. Leaf125 TaxID=1736265 RepID=UPI0006F3D750|nr:hypothetical protein [Methylobacterium sp. Leaf125]KQQ34273.1 hypothetical protein ASF58_23925 [Methylobacterium sp. Leaf125]